MKRKGIATIGIIGIIAAIAVVLIGFYVVAHNSIVKLEATVDTKASDIKTQLQRRADLIPNLVSTVQGYVEHEENVIDSITAARKEISGAKTIKEMSAANDKLNSALQSLNVIVENYPDLKASQNFINLQDELAGTENRIATARKDYNEAVKNYNTKISTIPTSIIANMMGKEKKDFFEVSDQSKLEVPEVNFNNSTNNDSKIDSDKWEKSLAYY